MDRLLGPKQQLDMQPVNIHEVLEMTVEEALAFMENVAAVRRPLQTLHDVGLDYIHLGQPATTLSGGDSETLTMLTLQGPQGSYDIIYLDAFNFSSRSATASNGTLEASDYDTVVVTWVNPVDGLDVAEVFERYDLAQKRGRSS